MVAAPITSGGRRCTRPAPNGFRHGSPQDAVDALPRSYVNPGSVGQPRDRDPRAAYLLWTPGGDGETSFGTLRWRRIDYEIDRTVAAMEAVQLPQGLRDRLYAGR
mgnify:CR=1 FL=1